MKRLLAFLMIFMLVGFPALADQWPSTVEFMIRYNSMQMSFRSIAGACPALTSENFEMSDNLAQHFPTALNALVLVLDDTWAIESACYIIRDVDTITDENSMALFTPIICMFYACGGAETYEDAASALDIIGFPSAGGSGNSITIGNTSFSWVVFDPDASIQRYPELSKFVTQPSARSIQFIAKPTK